MSIDDHEAQKAELVPSDVYVPAAMPEAASQELDMLGLSSQFPERLQDFNTTLADSIGNYATNFAGYKFTLSPDVSRPVVGVTQRYVFPFDVEFDAMTNGRASLNIQPKHDEHAVLAALTTGQLQAILGESRVGFTVVVYEPLSDEVQHTIPLSGLTDEDALGFHPSSRIVISAEDSQPDEFPTSFSLTATQMNERGRDGIIPTLRLHGVEISGAAQVVENSLPVVTQLVETSFHRA